jgi:uncharacterized membrane protein
MQALFDQFVETASLLIGMAGVLIIIMGLSRGLVQYFCKKRFSRIRRDIEKHLLFGLDFLLAQDIIHTVLVSTNEGLWEELIKLSMVVLIRIILAYFLESDINQLEKNDKKLAKTKAH